MTQFFYEKEKTREISFPLGGIGTGCIGLGGNGQLKDVEIFNKPNKGSNAAFTHFAVKAEDETGLLDARVVSADAPPPYTGMYNRPQFNSYGFGVDRATLMGLPHFKDCVFQGEFPVAKLFFSEERFPGELSMEAFNPFIPLNDRDSTIPGAFFTLSVRNTGEKPVTYTFALTATNYYTRQGGTHLPIDGDGVRGIHLCNTHLPPEDPKYGDLSILTDGEKTARQLYWYRGNWFDNLSTFWKDFIAPGMIKERVYEGDMTVYDKNYAADDMATLESAVLVNPGETAQVRFVLCWNTPNCYNYWNPEPCDCGGGCCCGEQGELHTWKSYYATLFADSRASGIYAIREFDRLRRETLRFHDALFSSSLPREALDAVSANLATIKSPTCLRLEDGSLYGFEGCHCDGGCCEGSCTHVWNYTYAIPFLFPKLERSMRTLEYRYNMNPGGGMSFRLMLPLGRSPQQFRPCADGQFGTVMRVLREYKISGDIDWLREIWPMVKESIAYAWSPENYDKWDMNRDGILEGRQHHTLDMELFGPNAWLSGLYLGALLAGSELAAIMGEPETAREYREIYEKGRKRLNTELYNGEYFFQKVDLKDRSILDEFQQGGKSLQNQDVYTAYWNREQQELMYQIGEGCGIDQVLAGWHGDLIGMEDIFDREKLRSALGAIYRYNFIPNMREHFNPCRLYCVNDEGGLVICRWPKGKKEPFITAPYSEETMNGFEYQAASHMIKNGMEKEGLSCIRALRDRYDGEKRNPWNEFECGSNYARSMASYALLLIYSGFSYDLPRRYIGFSPLGDPEDFSCLWSLDCGWGEVLFERLKVTLRLLGGTLPLRRMKFLRRGTPVEILLDGCPAAFLMEGEEILLEEESAAEKEIIIRYR